MTALARFVKLRGKKFIEEFNFSKYFQYESAKVLECPVAQVP